MYMSSSNYIVKKKSQVQTAFHKYNPIDLKYYSTSNQYKNYSYFILISITFKIGVNLTVTEHLSLDYHISTAKVSSTDLWETQRKHVNFTIGTQTPKSDSGNSMGQTQLLQ